tara:strand:+ start:163 stop:432 length:270 start_codon:yes stop_codon:yes gene_type:complete
MNIEYLKKQVDPVESVKELQRFIQIGDYGRDMYDRGVAGGKSLGLSLLHLELLKHGIGADEKFLKVLNKLRDEFTEELDFLVEKGYNNG